MGTSRGSRIFVIGRTRGDVPRLAKRLEETYNIPVQQLRGDMADTNEHSSRNRRRGVRVNEAGTRVEMMERFRKSAPSDRPWRNRASKATITRRLVSA